MKSGIIVFFVIMLVSVANFFPRTETVSLITGCGPATTCSEDYDFTDYGLFSASFKELAPGWNGINFAFFDNHSVEVGGLITNTSVALLVSGVLVHFLRRLHFFRR